MIFLPSAIRTGNCFSDRKSSRKGLFSLRGWLRLPGVLVTTMLLWASPLPLSCYGGVPRIEQDQVKAVFLYNFLHFVNWPNLSDSYDSLLIGIVGESSINHALEELAVKVTTMNKTAIRIASFGKFKNGMDLSACQILFVNGSEKENFQKIVASLKNAPVLTVGDTADFLSAGGMIAILERQNRIRYQINREAATLANLRLSSQLLKTAIDAQLESD